MRGCHWLHTLRRMRILPCSEDDSSCCQGEECQDKMKLPTKSAKPAIEIDKDVYPAPKTKYITGE